MERELRQAQLFRSNTFYRDKTQAASAGTLAERGELGFSDPHAMNGIPPLPRSSSFKDVREDKVKGPLVERRGRFLVKPEDDVEQLEPTPQSSAFSQPTFIIIAQRRSPVQQNSDNHATEGSNVQRLSRGVSKNFSRSTSGASATDSDLSSEREIDQLYITQLQHRIADLADELHQVKLKNIQLEHELIAIKTEQKELIPNEESASEIDKGI
ncbi:unnamed protein product [Calypogeia fissa]